MNIKSFLLLTLFFLLSIILTQTSYAGEEEDMAAMQKRLNAEVMEKPFSVADEKKIDGYIKDAMKKDLKPPETAPNFWQPGYTCASIYNRGWSYYRSCRYYRHYHGRYWY